MKKLSAMLTVLLLSVGILFAQDNDATVSQTGDNQDSYVKQDGRINEAKVVQLSDNTGPQVSDVIQSGFDNYAEVRQSQTGIGDITLNEAFMKQVGNLNWAKQVENAPGYNSGQKVWGYQDGNRNVLNQSILGGYTESLKATQLGNKNQTTQTIDGGGGGGHNHGIVYQDGTSNFAVQTLKGNNNGYSSALIRIKQFGTANYASQSFVGNGQGHMNNGTIYQDGFENDAWQNGDGRDLDAQLTQVGNYNWSKQLQTGNDLVSIVKQTGSGHHSMVTQTGNTDYSMVIQTN